MQEQSVEIVNVPSVDFISKFVEWLKYAVTHYESAFPLLKWLISSYIAISIPACLFLFLGIIICAERLRTIRKKEHEIFNVKVEPAYREEDKKNAKGNPDFARRWDKISAHVESQNENDWRQAIIEADILLGDLLTKLGYKGEGIGEQLKRANKADFRTIDEAWEAHKVRNELAHAGSDFVFSQLDARRVIQLYRVVFEEFFYI